jgi:hypothetical protein
LHLFTKILHDSLFKTKTMKTKSMNTFKKHTLKIVTFFAAVILLASCGKDDNNTPTPSPTAHKVIFKAEASAGSNISIAVYGYDASTTTASSLSGTTWTSPEITVPAGTVVASAAVNATGANASSTLKVQVWVDGVMKKEATSSGAFLSAQATYNF